MKKETPHSLKRGAGLADGLTTVAPVAGSLTTGRDQKAKRSPKEPSAVPGTMIQVSQVGFDRLGRDHVTRWARSDGSAPASKIVEGIGTARPFGGGCRPMPSLRLSPTSNNH
jgi:hypothetical protein